VVKIIRLRIGTLRLGSLKPREWRYLTKEEVMELKGEKVLIMEKRLNRSRPSQGRRDSTVVRRNPKDKPKRRPDAIRRNPKDKPKRRPDDRSRSDTKPRTPRR
jgi:23S rRNA pseudouridine2605 synthase